MRGRFCLPAVVVVEHGQREAGERPFPITTGCLDRTFEGNTTAAWHG